MRLRLRERGGESEGKRLREKVTHRHSHTQTHTHRHRHRHTHTHITDTRILACIHVTHQLRELLARGEVPDADGAVPARRRRKRPCEGTVIRLHRGAHQRKRAGVCAGVRAGVWGEGKEVVQEWAGGCMCLVACAWVRNTVRDRGTVCACVDRTSSPKTRALMAGRALAGATATSSTTCSCAVSVNLHSPPLLAHTRTVCCGHTNMHQRR